MTATASSASAPAFRRALAAGSERLAGWADLLDRINVFPVADGDTGRNLVISLQPLKNLESSQDELIEALLMAARGNSGNIAAQFFQGLVSGFRPADLAGAVEQGRALAWRAVADPKPGTMLSLFDALAEALGEQTVEPSRDLARLDQVLDRLEHAVSKTRSQLDELSRAGVVDSGALGMFLFMDGFLNTLHDRPEGLRPVADRFRGSIEVDAGFDGGTEQGFCVDAVIRSDGAEQLLTELRSMGESLVSLTRGDLVKIHLHTADPKAVQEKLRGRADLLRFASDDLRQQTGEFARAGLVQAIHVMTDAAGSVTRADARRLGLTVLDSYVNIGGQSIPETHLEPADLYAAMRAGVHVATSQASVFERHQHYRKMLGLYPKVLYLCVGSVFTGNHAVVQDFKRRHDPDDRLAVIDTGAASGRLALIALVTARRALGCDDSQAVIDLARRAVEASREWIFLDQLKWLAAGGRLSKSSAFFGDLLSMKPVVSPTAQGAKKVAVVRNQQAQIDFALARLAEVFPRPAPGLVLLEYTDNRAWVEQTVLPLLTERLAEAEIVLQPVSLTSGAHMGPGTWALACLPALD